MGVMFAEQAFNQFKLFSGTATLMGLLFVK